MSQTFQYQGYDGSVEYSAEDRILHGSLQGFAMASYMRGRMWVDWNRIFEPLWTSTFLSARKRVKRLNEPSVTAEQMKFWIKTGSGTREAVA
jgi:hypothetical protein